MAKNFNIRRSTANYTDNVKDACDHLSQILRRSHFIDMEIAPALMNQLNDEFGEHRDIHRES